MTFDGATGEVSLLGRLVWGYYISPMGSVIGLLWAPANGFIGDVIFAWLYNRLDGFLGYKAKNRHDVSTACKRDIGLN